MQILCKEIHIIMVSCLGGMTSGHCFLIYQCSLSFLWDLGGGIEKKMAALHGGVPLAGCMSKSVVSLVLPPTSSDITCSDLGMFGTMQKILVGVQQFFTCVCEVRELKHLVQGNP